MRMEGMMAMEKKHFALDFTLYFWNWPRGDEKDVQEVAPAIERDEAYNSWKTNAYHAPIPENLS